MKTFIVILLLAAYAAAARGQSSQTVYLNKKNLVYVIFERDIVDIIYDNDMVQDERPSARKDMVGLRLSARADTSAIGCMVELKDKQLQHLWLKYAERIQPTVHIGGGREQMQAAMPSTPSVIIPSAVFTPDTSIADKNLAAKKEAERRSRAERDSVYRADSAETAARNAALAPVMAEKAQTLLQKPAAILQLGAENGSLTVLPLSIGVDAAHLYVCIEFNNASKVDYYIKMQGLQIHYKRKGLRAGATGKDYMAAAGSYNEPYAVRAGKKYRYVFIYDLFTLKNNQGLEFFVRENNGGRNIDVEIPSKYLYEGTYAL